MFVGESPLQMGYITANIGYASGTSPATDVPKLRGDVETVNAAGAEIPSQIASRRVSPLNATSTSTTYASVADLAVALNRIGSYDFEYILFYHTSDVTEGIGVQVAFSGTTVVADNPLYSIEAYTDPATLAPLQTFNSFATGVTPFTAGPGLATRAIIRVRGSLNAASTGTLNLQFRAETGGLQSAVIEVGSYVNVWQVG